MDIIQCIRRLYNGNIRLCPPFTGEPEAGFPPELLAVLRESNGVWETMVHPKTGEVLVIARALYPYEQIEEETGFLSRNGGPEGWAFTDNGADCVYLLKKDGTVTCYDSTDGTEKTSAPSLAKFYLL